MPPRPLRILQGNLNHCGGAQDLARQTMREWSIDLAVFAEPYALLDRADWLGDAEGLVAVVSPSSAGVSSATLRERGRGYVACEWCGFGLVATYFSPNLSLAEFEGFLETLDGVVTRLRPRPIVVMGDLNAKSREWGCPRTDARGAILADWARDTGLDVVNRGDVWTCVRANGGSVVDVAFASHRATAAIDSWRVETEAETLSDHRYIRFDIVTAAATRAMGFEKNGRRDARGGSDRRNMAGGGPF